MNSTPPVETSTAGGRHDTELHKATMDIRSIDPSSTGSDPHSQIYDILNRLVDSRLAALREQLAQAKEETKVITNAHKVALNTQLGMLAALKQKDEEAKKIVFWCEEAPAGIEPETLNVWMGEAATRILAIQPDSTALKTVIEAETAREWGVLNWIELQFQHEHDGRAQDMCSRIRALRERRSAAAAAHDKPEP